MNPHIGLTFACIGGVVCGVLVQPKWKASIILIGMGLAALILIIISSFIFSYDTEAFIRMLMVRSADHHTYLVDLSQSVVMAYGSIIGGIVAGIRVIISSKGQEQNDFAYINLMRLGGVSARPIPKRTPSTAMTRQAA